MKNLIMQVEEEMTIQTFSSWKVDALKEFVLKRGLKKEGAKATLVVRAFVAQEINLTIEKTIEELANEHKKEYRDLLVMTDRI